MALDRALSLVHCGDWVSVCLASPTLAAGEFETVILKDGQRVVGEIVAERPAAIYVDLGYDILRIPRDQVLRRAKGVEAAAGPRAIAPVARGRRVGLLHARVCSSLRPSRNWSANLARR